MKMPVFKKIFVYLLCLGLLLSQLPVKAETLPEVGPKIGESSAEETPAPSESETPEEVIIPVESTDETEPEPVTVPEPERNENALSVEAFLALRNAQVDSRQTLDLLTEHGAEAEGTEAFEETLLRTLRLRRMAEASDMDIVVFRGNGWLNVRAEADANSTLVGKLYYDDTATVRGKAYTDNGVWFQIESGNVWGYVKSEFVLSGYEAAEVISESATRFAYILKDAQRIYRYDDSGSDIIGVAEGGRKYQIDWIYDYFTTIVYAQEGNNNVLFGYIPNDSYELSWELQTGITIEEENNSLAEMMYIRNSLEALDVSREESRRVEESIRQSLEESRAEAERWRQASLAASRAERERQESIARASRERASWEAASRAAAEAERNRQLRSMNYGNFSSMIPEGTSQTRISIVQNALSYVGRLPYVTGGTSLSTGVDCSGFLMAIYAQYGVHLAHYSYSIARTGVQVVGGLHGAIRPGDIICYRTWNGGGHVAMFIGWNYDGKPMKVHAPDVGWTITVDEAYEDGLHTVRNVLWD